MTRHLQNTSPLTSKNIFSLYYVNKYPKSGETILAKKVLKDIGGKGFNQAVAARRTGVNVSFWTCTGSDEVSEKIIKILGTNKQKKVIKSELKSRKFARRSVVAKRNLKKNSIIREKDLITLRPNVGIPANFWKKVIGRKIKRNLKANNSIRWKDLRI